jgi:hypothetical protein
MAKKVDKPIRLYVMTIFIVIAYGVLPMVSVFPFTGGFLLVGPRFLPYNGSFQVLYGPDGEASQFLLVMTISLCALAAGAAVMTFLGIKEARWPTLIILAFDVAWWFFLVISAILGTESGPPALELGLQLIFPLPWLLFVWWNMTRPDIKAWLDYQAELDS